MQIQSSYLIRFEWWVRLFIASIILLFSIFAYKSSNETIGDIRGSLIVTSLSIGVSFTGGVASFLYQTSPQSSKRLESVLIITTVILWGVASTVSNLYPTPSYDYFDTGDNPADIARPNVFLFAYVCVVASVVLFGSWFQQYAQNEDSVTPTTGWILLAATSFVVMIAAIGIRDIRLEDIINELNSTIPTVSGGQNATVEGQNDESVTLTEETDDVTSIADTNDKWSSISGRTSFCSVSDAINCTRVDFAIVLGGLSAACACVTAPWKNAPLGCMTDLSFLLFVAWSCGVGLLTFGNGPGRTMGTIYFGTWFSLFLCLDILMNVSAQLSNKQQHDPRQQQLVQHESSLTSAAASTAAAIFTTTTVPRRNGNNNDNRPDEQQRNEFLETAFGHLGRQTQLFTIRPMSEREFLGRSLSGSIFSSVGFRSWNGDVPPEVDRESRDTNHNLDGRSLPSDASEDEHPSTLNIHKQRDQMRSLQLWVALLITSIVCLAALYPILPEPGSRSRIQKVGLAVPSFGIIVSCCGYLANVRKGSHARRAELTVVSL
jgi:hypothetical protein